MYPNPWVVGGAPSFAVGFAYQLDPSGARHDGLEDELGLPDNVPQGILYLSAEIHLHVSEPMSRPVKSLVGSSERFASCLLINASHESVKQKRTMIILGGVSLNVHHLPRHAQLQKQTRRRSSNLRGPHSVVSITTSG